ncbi:MAG: S1 RNA-binding domain-containing protein [Candidatus Yanofskybacteria bacterium]|nr:S1 RNA-binding domain-containing protein [Candidatus Yanofskybacteria bacterium]
MEIFTQINDGLSMKDLLAKSGFDLPKIGQVVTGEIISIGKNAVMVDLGSLGTGIVYPGEFYDRPDMQKALKAGQQISAILLDIENEDGYRELSLKRAQMTTAWEDIRRKKESGEVITTKIININKGGLIVEIDGIQGFLPLSQLTPEHYPKVEGGDTTKIVQALQKLRNQEIQIKILDFSEDENRLIVSEKAIDDAQLKEELTKFNVGDIVEAEITDVTDFGAFATLAQPPTEKDELKQPELAPAETQPVTSYQLPVTRIEGLIHISEIDWKLVENPRDYLQTGQRVQAKIIGIDDNKVSLSLKALKPNPWEKIEEKYQVGQILDREIAKINNYGVAVKLDDEVSGFLPASEFSESKIPDSLKIGDKLNVAIVSIDTKEHKIMLTLQKNA